MLVGGGDLLHQHRHALDVRREGENALLLQQRDRVHRLLFLLRFRVLLILLHFTLLFLLHFTLLLLFLLHLLLLFLLRFRLLLFLFRFRLLLLFLLLTLLIFNALLRHSDRTRGKLNRLALQHGEIHAVVLHDRMHVLREGAQEAQHRAHLLLSQAHLHHLHVRLHARVGELHLGRRHAEPQRQVHVEVVHNI